MGRADIHIHSGLVGGPAGLQQLLQFVEQGTDLDVIALTGSDDIAPGQQAREAAKSGSFRFEVVVGMEVTTQDGYLLALFIERPVAPGLTMARAAELVHSQGGLCIVSHPMSWLDGSIGQGNLDRLMARRNGSTPDGLELISAKLVSRGYTLRARHLNEKRYKVAEVGSSGATKLEDIGRAYTVFPGRTSEDLRRALLERSSRAERARNLRPGMVLGPVRRLGDRLSRLWRGVPR